MGLSFHYSGRIRSAAMLPAMIEEMMDIAEIYQWKYKVYEETFKDGMLSKPSHGRTIHGISFTPPNCETIWLCFLSNGKLSSPVHLRFYGNSRNKKEHAYLYRLSVKTQHAGLEIHKTVINLLQYISKKYLKDFNVEDEGKYWNTHDEQLLQDMFSQYTNLINNFTSSLKDYSPQPGELLDKYFERVLKNIHKKYKNK